MLTFVWMERCFFKYHGAGNDFILFDDRMNQFPLKNKELITHLCHRHFGIGSDGLLLIQESDEADVHLEFFNPDASQSFCGNGSRCGIQFARDIGMIGEQGTFTAIDGAHEYSLIREGQVRISMRDVKAWQKSEEEILLNTGSPHLVRFLNNHEELDKLDVKAEGAAIRYSPEYAKDGVNVNWAVAENSEITMRTYERGVEDETLACGTGVTAAALALAINTDMDSGSVRVKTLGGTLSVFFLRAGSHFHAITLQGPAKKVYAGDLNATDLAI